MRGALRLAACLMCLTCLLLSAAAQAAPLGARIVLSVAEEQQPELLADITCEQTGHILFTWDTERLEWVLSPEARIYSTLTITNQSAVAADIRVTCVLDGGEGQITGVSLSETKEAGGGAGELTLSCVPAGGAVTLYLHFAYEPPQGSAEQIDATATVQVALSASE